MSATLRQTEAQAILFAALGDPTRLSLVKTLTDGQARSIATLTTGRDLTRQAVTRHLTVLENVGLVSKAKDGREILYELDPAPLASMQECLERIGTQWDSALQRLKALVEEE